MKVRPRVSTFSPRPPQTPTSRNFPGAARIAGARRDRAAPAPRGGSRMRIVSTAIVEGYTRAIRVKFTTKLTDTDWPTG